MDGLSRVECRDRETEMAFEIQKRMDSIGNIYSKELVNVRS